MYSYSFNSGVLSNAESVLRLAINKLFSQIAEPAPAIVEYEMPVIESSDIEDVNLSQAGNHEAYKRLIEKYEQEIAKNMWRFSRDILTHEELVQDVFVEAYLSLNTYQNQAPFLHWLRKIATRVGYRYWKEFAKQNHSKNITLKEWDQVLSETPEEINSERATEIIHFLLEKLSLRDRLVLTLRFVEGCSVEETSYRTGWTKSMVKVQTIRAKRKLKKMFPNA